ncbi:MAG: hypothetical protein Q7T05_08365 [Dehalococcoidia bacterium]|nr:hypothetical protein [Dehalococcoidia bacterium]
MGEVVLADTTVEPNDGDYVVGYMSEYGDVAMRYREQGDQSWVECNDGRAGLDQCNIKGVIVERTVKFRP